MATTKAQTKAQTKAEQDRIAKNREYARAYYYRKKAERAQGKAPSGVMRERGDAKADAKEARLAKNREYARAYHQRKRAEKAAAANKADPHPNSSNSSNAALATISNLNVIVGDKDTMFVQIDGDMKRVSTTEFMRLVTEWAVKISGYDRRAGRS